MRMTRRRRHEVQGLRDLPPSSLPGGNESRTYTKPAVVRPVPNYLNPMNSLQHAAHPETLIKRTLNLKRITDRKIVGKVALTHIRNYLFTKNKHTVSFEVSDETYALNQA